MGVLVDYRATLSQSARYKVPDSQNEQRDLRSDVLQHRKDARRVAEHYQLRHRRFTRLQLFGNVLLVGLGSGCFVSAFAIAITGERSVPEPLIGLQQILGVLLAVVVLWSLIANHAVKSALALSVAREIYEIVRRFTELLSDIDAGVDDPRARQEFERLLDRLAETTLRFGDVGTVDVSAHDAESTNAPSFAGWLVRLFRPQSPLRTSEAE
ncbi:MAG: hypothetical protein OXP09_12340 [Gammaproteobacteria bacterium]|nr:hypothetical protein [Gammaproteobacteria bacterium]